MNITRGIRPLFDPGFRAVILYRWSVWCFSHHIEVLSAFLLNLNLAVHGCIISYRARIGRGMIIAHPVGLVVGNIVAGENLVLAQNVTIGNRDHHQVDGRKDPILGDRVTVNCGAVVIGPITVGNDVVVGANAVVLKDVPDNWVVVGVPATRLR